MTETFTASNGAVVWRTAHAQLVVGNNWIVPENAESALREFFQNQRDRELGRWRWPESPDYVVYANGDYARVARERAGTSEVFHRVDSESSSWKPAAAARAYFEAHPERKPWEDAKPGEVWLLTINGDESAFYPSKSLSRAFTPVAPNTGMTAVTMNWPEITAGRRIFPEEP